LGVLVAMVLRAISLKILTIGEMSMQNLLLSSLNLPFAVSVVTETFWAILVSLVAGLAYADAEYMSVK
jgi:hypothetical protein